MMDNGPEINTNLVAPVQISEPAMVEIRDTFAANKLPATYALRVGLRGGGCSASFLLGFDERTADDQLYFIEDIRVIIDRRHLMYVLGAEIHFEEDALTRGFTVRAKGLGDTL